MIDKKRLFLTDAGLEKIEGFVSDNLKFFYTKAPLTAYYQPSKFCQDTRLNNYIEKLYSQAIKSASLQLKNGERIEVKVELSDKQTESGRRRVLNLTKKHFCFE